MQQEEDLMDGLNFELDIKRKVEPSKYISVYIEFVTFVCSASKIDILCVFVLGFCCCMLQTFFCVRLNDCCFVFCCTFSRLFFIHV